MLCSRSYLASPFDRNGCTEWLGIRTSTLSQPSPIQQAQSITGRQSRGPATTRGLIPLRFVTETGVTCSFVPRSHDALKLKGFLGHPITTPSY
jgi:hypothetical protein